LVQLLSLADDLTGALEVGAKFAMRGVESAVTIERRLRPESQVLVIDTETRHLAPSEAAKVVYGLASEASSRGITRIFKKTDSTLRGNIGAELDAVMQAFPGQPLIYAPAYAEMGRTLREGSLYVDGQLVHESSFGSDALNPVRDSFVPNVIAQQSARRVIVGDPGPEAAIYIVDSAQPTGLSAGTGAMADCLAASFPIGDRLPWPKPRTFALINGSQHEVSAEQARRAVSHGWRIPPDTTEDALVIFGGDTAFQTVCGMGVAVIHPLGEVLPGVPISRIVVNGRDWILITKAGGFGPPDVAAQIEARLARDN
jgi:uncharacterized protein YgbK (DUF1537 family)